ILVDGEQRWSLPWQEIGLTLDMTATVQSAYAVGRAELPLLQRVGGWVTQREIPAVFSVDLVKARGVLEQLSTQISVPAVDASVRLENGQAVIVPGTPGRVLDVTTTLMALNAVPVSANREAEVTLVFQTVQPTAPDLAGIQAEVEQVLARSVALSAYDVLTDETLTWTLSREAIAPWLRITAAEDGSPRVQADPAAVQTTLDGLAAALGDGRGFRAEEAAAQVLEAFEQGGGNVVLYLTHPTRTYAVQAGDTLTSLSSKFGMPPGLVAEANTEIDVDKLSVGQEVTIPSQDLLTPYLAVSGKKIVINIAEQKMRVYENGALLHEWVVSTGIASSPTHRGVFQIVSKVEEAYASQWDLWMPYFMGIYPAGGTVYNGIHELPILSSGQRLWEGTLGSPASFGCIILGIPQAETLYAWAEIGVVVVIE
ncbi:MAG: peptidoglycan binding domain-containing protein, partial [Anaerolineae bacterium]|nr:peptidoglycan binding domain-containing protein [Anaerolineae bacterium]